MKKPKKSIIEKYVDDMPREVLIGAFPWKIEVHPTGWLPDPRSTDSEKYLYGMTDFGRGTITVSHPSVMADKTRVAATILHEALHVIWDNHGIGATKGKVEEEHAVTMLERGLTSLFMTNPEFTKWLMKGFVK